MQSSITARAKRVHSPVNRAARVRLSKPTYLAISFRKSSSVNWYGSRATNSVLNASLVTFGSFLGSPGRCGAQASGSIWGVQCRVAAAAAAGDSVTRSRSHGNARHVQAAVRSARAVPAAAIRSAFAASRSAAGVLIAGLGGGGPCSNLHMSPASPDSKGTGVGSGSALAGSGGRGSNKASLSGGGS